MKNELLEEEELQDTEKTKFYQSGLTRSILKGYHYQIPCQLVHPYVLFLSAIISRSRDFFICRNLENLVGEVVSNLNEWTWTNAL